MCEEPIGRRGVGGGREHSGLFGLLGIVLRFAFGGVLRPLACGLLFGRRLFEVGRRAIA